MIKFDSKGKMFNYETFELTKQEYAKIVSEINTNYAIYENEKFCMHNSVGYDNEYYIYYFENHGFNDYNIYNKIELK